VAENKGDQTLHLCNSTWKPWRKEGSPQKKQCSNVQQQDAYGVKNEQNKQDIFYLRKHHAQRVDSMERKWHVEYGNAPATKMAKKR